MMPGHGGHVLSHFQLRDMDVSLSNHDSDADQFNLVLVRGQQLQRQIVRDVRAQETYELCLAPSGGKNTENRTSKVRISTIPSKMAMPKKEKSIEERKSTIGGRDSRLSVRSGLHGHIGFPSDKFAR